MYELTKYEDAKRALAICASIDEAKDIQDKSEAMRLYAKMSENTELEVYVSTIKVRAQIRLGEIIAAMETAKNQHVPAAGIATKSQNLADAGISKSSANRYEQLAAIPAEVIEKTITESTEAKKPVSMTKILNTAKPPKPPNPKPAPLVTVSPEPEKQRDEPPVASDNVILTTEQHEELMQMVEEAHADQIALEKVLDADDKLAEAVKEIKRLTALIDTYKSQLEGANNKNNELIRIIKSKDKEIKKLEKQIKDSEEALPI